MEYHILLRAANRYSYEKVKGHELYDGFAARKTGHYEWTIDDLASGLRCKRNNIRLKTLEDCKTYLNENKRELEKLREKKEYNTYRNILNGFKQKEAL